MKKRLIFIIAITIGILAADQLSKLWARDTLRGISNPPNTTLCNPRSPGIALIPGYLHLEYHENPGSAFGMLRDVPGARYILIGVGLIALVIVWRMLGKVSSNQRLADVAFAFVAGGALGNLADRIYMGRVVDFILMHIKCKYIWPAYNVADVALVFGVGFLIIVFGKKPKSTAPIQKRRSRKKK